MRNGGESGCVPVRRRARGARRVTGIRRDVRTDRDDQVVITGSVDVRSGESVDRVLIFDGDVRVNGVVSRTGCSRSTVTCRRRPGQR